MVGMVRRYEKLRSASVLPGTTASLRPRSPATIWSRSGSATLVPPVEPEASDECEGLMSCDEAREDESAASATGLEGGDEGGERLRRSRMSGGGWVVVDMVVVACVLSSVEEQRGSVRRGGERARVR